MLGGESVGDQDPPTTFQRVVNKFLNLNLKSKDIYPIYDYFHDKLEKVNYVFYAEVKNSPAFHSNGANTLSWLRFDETMKLLFSGNTKQDVVVGERVINLKWRLSRNIQPGVD